MCWVWLTSRTGKFKFFGGERRLLFHHRGKRQWKIYFAKDNSGLLKPVSGEVIFSADWNKKEIGFLPQQTDIQKTFPATVKEIVLSGCQANLGWWPFYKKSDVELAYKNLEKLGMTDYAKRSFKELSGGQQQRVLLARTLCAAKSVLILDEPAKGFDSEITETMYKLLDELNKAGITIITISHDLEAAQKYGSKILKLGKTWEIVK